MRTQSRTVNGDVEVTVTQLPALRLLREWSTVARRLLPVLSAIHDAEEREADMTEIIPAFAALGDDADDVAMRLLSSATAKVCDEDGQRLVDLSNRANVDAVFRGNLLGLFQAAFFAVEVHYGDFLSGAGD